MIAFDNGPAHGDYVRYIDDLLKRSAVATANAAPAIESSVGTLGQTRDRLAALARTSAGAQEPARADRSTGFTTLGTPTASAAAAAAIASALASGQMTGRTVPIHAKVGLSAILLGIVIVIIGFVSPLNIVAIVGGGVLIAWAVRMMRDAAART